MAQWTQTLAQRLQQVEASKCQSHLKTIDYRERSSLSSSVNIYPTSTPVLERTRLPMTFGSSRQKCRNFHFPSEKSSSFGQMHLMSSRSPNPVLPNPLLTPHQFGCKAKWQCPERACDRHDKMPDEKPGKGGEMRWLSFEGRQSEVN